MKNKGNKLLAVALLGLSVMLVGCDPDEKKLTETQKTALLGVTKTGNPILIEVGTNGGYTYSYKSEAGTALTKATLVGTDAVSTEGIAISTVKPELGGTIGKVDLSGASDIKSGSFLLTSGTLTHTVSSTAGDNNKDIYVANDQGADEASANKAASYVSTYSFSIDVTPKDEDKKVSVSGTVTYDTTGGTPAANCTNFDPTTNQGTELQYESKGTGLYAAISTAGEFLICKKS